VGLQSITLPEFVHGSRVDRASRSSRATIHRVGGVELVEHAAKLHSLGLGPAARFAKHLPRP
jgi:hypothetical protein